MLGRDYRGHVLYKYLSYYNSIKGERKIKNCHIIDKALCQKLIEFIDLHLSQSNSEDAKKFAINYFLSLISNFLLFSLTSFQFTKIYKLFFTYNTIW